MKRLFVAVVAAAALTGTTGSALAVPLHAHVLTNTKSGSSTVIGLGFCAQPDLFGPFMALHDVFEHHHYTVHSGAPGAATLGGNADVAFTNPNNPVKVTAIACPAA